MAGKHCWACLKPILEKQKICLECNSWQNWQRFVTISNTSVALLIALLSVGTLVGTQVKGVYDEYYPLLEVHISGHFNSEARTITLDTYNFGSVSANFGSNINCVFGLEDAMGHPKDNDGLEIEFWTIAPKRVDPHSAHKIEYIPQASDFDPESSQVLCFGALNYHDRATTVEPFFLAIIPREENTWWAIEGWPTTERLIELMYPKPVTFQPR